MHDYAETTPSRIKQFFLELQAAITRNTLTLVSAGVAFYFFLALVPGLIAVVSLYGLVFSAETAADQIKTATDALPPSAAQIVTDQVNAIVDSPQSGLGAGLVIGLALALWSASAGMLNLIRGISVAYDNDEQRNYLALRAIALVLTVCALVFGIVSIIAITALPQVLRAFGLGDGGGTLISILRWPVLVVVMTIGLAILYRIGNYSERLRHRRLSWGSMTASVLWVIMSAVFGIFVANFGRYNEVYGSLAGVIILLLWLFLTAFVILLGAEINAVLADIHNSRVTERARRRARRPGGLREAAAGLVLAAFAVGSAIMRRRHGGGYD